METPTFGLSPSPSPPAFLRPNVLETLPFHWSIFSAEKNAVESEGQQQKHRSSISTFTVSTDSGFSESPSLLSLACSPPSAPAEVELYKRKSASFDHTHNFGHWPPPRGFAGHKRRGTEPSKEQEHEQKMRVFEEIETYRKRVENEEEQQNKTEEKKQGKETEQKQDELEVIRGKEKGGQKQTIKGKANKWSINK